MGLRPTKVMKTLKTKITGRLRECEKMPFLRQRDLFERVGKSERSRIRRIGKTR